MIHSVLKFSPQFQITSIATDARHKKAVSDLEMTFLDCFISYCFYYYAPFFYGSRNLSLCQLQRPAAFPIQAHKPIGKENTAAITVPASNPAGIP